MCELNDLDLEAYEEHRKKTIFLGYKVGKEYDADELYELVSLCETREECLHVEQVLNSNKQLTVQVWNDLMQFLAMTYGDCRS